MKSLLDMKVVNCLPPSSKDNDDFDGPVVPVDTQGLSELVFLVQAGSLAAAIGSETEAAALKIGECDTADGVYTDVDDAELSAPIAGDDDDKVFVIRVDLRRTHKRYMKPIDPHVGNGSATESYLAILALGLPDVTPTDAAGMGVAELVLA